MKKLLPVFLTLAALAVSRAGAEGLKLGEYAEVVRCKEFITLREDSDKKAKAAEKLPLGARVIFLGGEENGFAHVRIQSRDGWCLSEYLDPVPPEEGEPYEPEDAEKIRLNLFLTAFACHTNELLAEGLTDEEIIRFAIDYLWYFDHSGFESGEWGEDNTRISELLIDPAARRFFGRVPKKREVSGMGPRGGYYYWQETGGHLANGFALVTSAERLAGDRLRVRFRVFGGGEEWVPEAVCTMTEKQARASYPYGGDAEGMAVLKKGGESGWLPERFFVAR